MFYYHDQGRYYCALGDDLPLQPCSAAEADGKPLTFLFRRDPQRCRASFGVSSEAELYETEEGVFWLDAHQLLPPNHPHAYLQQLIQLQLLRAVNYEHPRWRELAAQPGDLPQKCKRRLHLLALGDVGATLLIGLRLLGAAQLSAIGICDINPRLAERWEFEINQINRPWEYDAFPPVQVVAPENLFDCDVFVFCASKGPPPVGARVADVRMAQLQENAAIIGHYARQAREARFRGLFAVVSDPVDALCRVALSESNRDESGAFDGEGLLPEQVQGYGLGVMNARAAYFAERDARFASFLTEGRAYGPHGADLVIANSIEHYDDALSCELTQLAVTANLQMRDLGYKPFVAPALSSGALSILATLDGSWHYSSTYLGGVYMGAKNRFTPSGLAVEILPLPPDLYARIQLAADHLAEIEVGK